MKEEQSKAINFESIKKMPVRKGEKKTGKQNNYKTLNLYYNYTGEKEYSSFG